MGPDLIAAVTPWFLKSSFWLTSLEVAAGLGFVIFVHELGHFLVAKACGVKCEKFYLGFDIYGLKLLKFQWGETEYGIGALPLGGYVKMLGQDDNPSAQRDEYARSRQGASASQTAAEHEMPHGDVPAEPLAEDHRHHDPRSYLAQTVPERMAIISAGVIMNIIFAFFMATFAFGYLGVEEAAGVIGQVPPGGAAWDVGVEPGSRLVRIGNLENPSFDALMSVVPVSNLKQGVAMSFVPPGATESRSVILMPSRETEVPKVGLSSASTTTLNSHGPVAIRYTSAAEAQPALARGDRIVAINGQPVDSGHAVNAALALGADRPLKLTIERAATNSGAKSPDRLEVTVPVEPLREFGMAMKLGPVVGVQQGSPAASSGVLVGDELTTIDGAPVGDPMTLAARMRARAGQTVQLGVKRREGDNTRQLTLSATLRTAAWIEEPTFPGSPFSVPELGLAYKVFSVVDQVTPNGPAAQAGLQPGDRILEALPLPPVGEVAENEDQGNVSNERLWKRAIPFKDLDSWPEFVVSVLPTLHPTAAIRFTVQRGETERKVDVLPQKSTEFFLPDRGLLLEPLKTTVVAGSWADAAALGADKTGKSLLFVFRLLQKLGSGQIAATSMGGLGTIAVQAYGAAATSLSSFLMFLTMLSANLAVINFLPIPVLDGGHMVFLIIEGIRRKPVTENIVISLHYFGLTFILALMVWVFGLDIYRFVLN